MRILISAAALTAALSSPAVAQPSLQQCRGIADSTARLACYDALADAATTQPTSAAAVPARAGAAAPVTPAAGPTAAPTPTPIPTPALTREAAFGLPEARRADAADAVHSAVGARFAGWGPNTRIRLDNGQVWQVTDGSSVVLPEGARKASVTRGLFGNFQLEIEGLKTTAKVKRVE